MTNVKKSIIRFAAILLAVLTTPVYAQISGHLTVCRGASRTMLTGTPGGGVWSSGDVTRATINSSTGEVAGVAAGTATITYVDPTTAVHTAVVTVSNYVMTPIGFSSGSAIRCTGGVPATCTVSPMNGNNWTSSDPTIATVNTGGLVVPSATNAGTVTISYRHGYGNCYVTRDVSVNPTPTVSVTNPVCVGVTQTATGAPSGGTWSSSNPGVGTINATTGVVSPFIGGYTYLRYTVSSCMRQEQLIVTAAPAAITGSTTMCVGSSAALSSSSTGGTWSSSDPSVATIGSLSGVVSGVSTGTTMISYIVGSGCFRTAVVTVNAAPSASAGPDEVCVGQSISLTNATGGGSWSSSNTSRATVTTYGGAVAGVSAGTVNISYRIGGGCATVKTITVNSTMASITGGPNVCQGASVTLAHGMVGGTWSASNSNAIVGASTGIMTGVTAGSVNITYTASPGCVKTQTMIVRSIPAAITGTLTVCPGSTTTLSSASGGGSWSSSNPSVALVNFMGLVTGVTGGTSVITYANGSGCHTTAVVTVSSSAGSISGSTSLCLGTGATFTSTASGGTWSSSNTSVATIGSSSGVVTSVGVGTTMISYNMAGGCLNTLTVTVLVTPASIGGITSVCPGYTTTLSNSVAGGTWSSSNPSVALVGSLTGVVTGVSTGTAIVTYAVASGCYTTVVVTVSSGAGVISGVGMMCAGDVVTLTSPAPGGTWTSADPAVAMVDTTGTVTAIAMGTSAITYNTGGSCLATTVVTVLSTPSAIAGSSLLCIGSTAVFSSAGGSYWTSSSPGIAAVGSSSGVVAGVSAGTATITVTDLTSGCFRVANVTITTSAGSISGGLSMCTGVPAVLSSSMSGGSWSSSNTSVATVGMSTGNVSPIVTGTTSISYSIGSSCHSAVVVTVQAMPSAITGPSSLCVGTSGTMTNAVPGGVWTSSQPGVATIDPASGVATATGAGTTTISYTIGSCAASVDVTVNAVDAGSLSGLSFVMPGSTLTLSATVAGGTWISSDVSVATVNSSGIVTGIVLGTSIIYYVVSNACGSDTASVIVTVTLTPPFSSSCSSSWAPLNGTTAVTWNRVSNIHMALGVCDVPYVFHDGTTVKEYNGEQFVDYGGLVDTAGSTVSAIAVDPTGVIYVAFADSAYGGRVTVKKYSGGAWVSVGTPGFSGAHVFHLDLKVAGDGTAFVAFDDNTLFGKATVMKYNGSSWETVGMPGFTTWPATNLSLHIDGTGVVYVSCRVGIVMKYTGSSWIELSVIEPYPFIGSAFAIDSANELLLAVNTDSFIVVKRYTGSTWTVMDTIRYSPGTTLSRPILTVGADNNPWLAVHKVFPTPVGWLEVYDVKRYNGTTWVPAGSNNLPWGGSSPYLASTSPWAILAVGDGNVAYLCQAGGDYHLLPVVSRLEQGKWFRLNGQDNGTLADANIMSMALGANGTPYLSYVVGPAAVRKYTGRWDLVGPLDYTEYSYIGTSYNPTSAFAIDAFGTPYVAFPEATPPVGIVMKVRRYDGSNWVPVGTDFYATDEMLSPSLVFDSMGTPFLNFYLWYSHLLKIRKYDGADWVDLDTGVHAGSTYYTNRTSPIVVKDTALHVFFEDDHGGGRGSVMKYEMGHWVYVGSSGFTAGSVFSRCIAKAADGTLYVAYSDQSLSGKLCVRRFDGSTWVPVGGPAITSVGTTSAALSVHGNTPYVAYIDSANAGGVTVLKYNGSSWVTVGEPGFAADAAYINYIIKSIAIDSVENVYVGFGKVRSYSSFHGSTNGIACVWKYGSPTETIFDHSICVGSSVPLISPEAGEWYSSNPAVANVDCAGVMTGVSAGTAIITYVHDTCYSTSIVTVNAAPSVGTISGPSAIVVGSSVTLTASIGGGVWSSSIDTVAAVTATGGGVTGLTTGFATISYTVTGGSCSSHALHSIAVAGARPEGGSEGQSGSLFTVAPNPTSGKLTVSSVSSGLIVFYTIDGRELFRIRVGSDTARLDVFGQAPPGIYLLRFTGGDGSIQTTRLIYQP